MQYAIITTIRAILSLYVTIVIFIVVIIIINAIIISIIIIINVIIITIINITVPNVIGTIITYLYHIVLLLLIY